MKSPEEQVALPLDYVAELAVEIDSMRRDCSDAAQGLMEEKHLDEAALEECAVLDEALSSALLVLQGAAKRITQLRTARRRAGK